MSSSMLLQQLHDAVVGNDFAYVTRNIHALPINQPLTNTNETAMHMCARNDQIDILALLLRHGALVNCRDSFGNTPLHSACLHNAYQAVQLLTKSGAAAIDAANARGITPLMVAVWCRYYDLVQLLLANGATLTSVSQDGAQALHYAALTGDASLMSLVAAKPKKLKGHDLSWQEMVRLQGQHWHLLNEEEQAIETPPAMRLDVMSAEDGMPQLIFSELDGDDICRNTAPHNVAPTAAHTMQGAQATMQQTRPNASVTSVIKTTMPEAATGETDAEMHVDAASYQRKTGADTAAQTAFDTSPVIAVTGAGVAITGEMAAVADTELNATHAAPSFNAVDDTLTNDMLTGEFEMTNPHAAVRDTELSVDTTLDEEGDQYSFSQNELQDTVDAITSGHMPDTDLGATELQDMQTDKQDPVIAHDKPSAQHADAITHALHSAVPHSTASYLNSSFDLTDSFDVSHGMFRAINGMYTNNVMVLTIANVLSVLDTPHQIDRVMHGTVTPGEQTPTFSFFDRNGNVIVWVVLDYDPFEDNNVSKWNETKLWYQNNGFSYDVNFFMSHANEDAVDSKEIYEMAQAIQQQM